MKANAPGLRIAALTLAGTAIVALGSCVPKQSPPPIPLPKPSPSPSPAPVRPLPAAQPAADWRDMAQTLGTWRWRATATTSQAEFGTDPAAPLFVVSCATATRIVSLIRPGAAIDAAPMRIVTTGPARALQAVVVPGPPPALGAALNAQDPLLDAIVFSRGRFMVESPGQPALYLPSWPEISRAVEDCR